ncbi:MAG: hypothetical protein RSF79_24575, partial [Janthinobacterium sp.]
VLLLSSTPEPFREQPVDVVASEDLPDLKKDQSGCLFCQRCPLATERCRREIPPEYVNGTRRVKCFLYENGAPEQPIDVSIYAKKERA